MSRNTRRLFFYFLVTIFIVATPLTILYAVGYSYDWQKHAIVQTGGIYLKSTPDGAQITVDGKKQGTTARLISRLTPRSYRVLVSKDGYSSWQKNLEVSPIIVTEARNIVLFPQKIEPELVATTPTSTLADFLRTDQEKQNQSQADQTASSSAGWLIKNTDIFFVSQNNFELYRETLDGSNQTQISKESLPPGYYRILTNDQRFFLALAQTGDLYFLNIDSGLWETIARGVKDAAVSDDNNKFLYWNNNEIWIYYPQDILIQPYKNAGEKELITRFAQTISQAIFYPDNEHIAFVVGNQIKITELDGRDQRNTVDFLQAPSPQIYFDQNTNYFYYKTNTNIYRLRLLI